RGVPWRGGNSGTELPPRERATRNSHSPSAPPLRNRPPPATGGLAVNSSGRGGRLSSRLFLPRTGHPQNFAPGSSPMRKERGDRIGLLQVVLLNWGAYVTAD